LPEWAPAKCVDNFDLGKTWLGHWLDREKTGESGGADPLDRAEIEAYGNSPGKIICRSVQLFVNVLFLRLRNDLYCVEWGVKLYSPTLTHLRKYVHIQFVVFAVD